MVRDASRSIPGDEAIMLVAEQLKIPPALAEAKLREACTTYGWPDGEVPRRQVRIHCADQPSPEAACLRSRSDVESALAMAPVDWLLDRADVDALIAAEHRKQRRIAAMPLPAVKKKASAMIRPKLVLPQKIANNPLVSSTDTFAAGLFRSLDLDPKRVLDFCMRQSVAPSSAPFPVGGRRSRHSPSGEAVEGRNRAQADPVALPASGRAPYVSGRSAEARSTANSSGPGGPGEMDPRQAPRQTILSTVTAVYDRTASMNMKPPNIKEVAEAVLFLLQMQGFTTTKAEICRVACGPEFQKRRLQVGRRASGSFLPFSLPEIWKSGSVS